MGVEEINYWQLINWERRNAGKERLANLKNFNVQVNNEPARGFLRRLSVCKDINSSVRSLNFRESLIYFTVPNHCRVK